MVANFTSIWRRLSKECSRKLDSLWKTARMTLVEEPAIPSTSFSVSSIPPDKRVWGKRCNYALLLCYSGHRYYGMQRQMSESLPTIELHLWDALYRLRLITNEERTNGRLFQYQRASRTDKGVSAARQICNMLLPLGGLSSKKCEEYDGIIYTPQTVLGPLNAQLPEDFRVLGIKRVTRKFNARRYCDSRHYTYTLPSYAFSPITEEESNFRNYRIPTERVIMVNQVLSLYKGKRNFYNFTTRKLFAERNSWRFIRACECTEPFIRNGVEFLTVHFIADGFMMHQIRKMIGLCIAIVRGHVGIEAVDKCWEPEKTGTPTAPGLGLVLHNLYYHGYYKRYGKTHEPVLWNECDDEVQKFREKYIDTVIYNAELSDDSPMREWLATQLAYHYAYERRSDRESISNNTDGHESGDEAVESDEEPDSDNDDDEEDVEDMCEGRK